MRLPLGLGAAAGCLLLAGACGGDDGPNAKRFDGEKKDVAAVIDELQTAARDDKPGRICDEIFASQLRALIERETGESCADRMRAQIINEEAKFTARRVKLDGKNKAIVNVTDGAGNRSVLYMAKTDGEWRVVQIAR